MIRLFLSCGANYSFLSLFHVPHTQVDPRPVTNGRLTQSRDNTKLDGKALENNGHEVGEQDDEQQHVSKAGTTSQIGGPVAWIHISDTDD